MRQRKLPGPTRATDRECAEIIKADPVKYPGLMQRWAERVLAGDDSKPNLDRLISRIVDLEFRGL